MINAPYEEEFVFHDGRRAKNLLELYSTLETMGQQDFERFVNPGKNDFANWAEYVLLDKELASSLRSTILFQKTKDIINKKIMLENDSRLTPNAFSNEKKSLFKILMQEKNNSMIEARRPIEKLPEPERHETIMLPVPEKKRWFKRKEKTLNSNKLTEVHIDKESNNGLEKKPDKEQDKDGKNNNPLSKWYSFNKRKHIDNDAKNVLHAAREGGNIAWILLYCILIIAIIAIIAYKFVL